MLSSEELLVSRLRSLVKPKAKMTVSEWAEEFRYLPASSAQRGKWHNSKVPFMVEIMDCVTDPTVTNVVFKKSSQVSGTEGAIHNAIGYHMEQDPCPILVVQATLTDAEKWSKLRFDKMIEATETLQALMPASKSRDGGNTILEKQFPGGSLSIVGANVPSGFASLTMRIVFFDEVDRYEPSAGTEGDQIVLGMMRTTTYRHSRKHVMVSTPGNSGQPGQRGTSRIHPLFMGGDQRYYYVPCKHCGEMQRLIWERVEWNEEARTAHIKCIACPEFFEEIDKEAFLAAGEWRASAPFKGTASFSINSLYSPFITMWEIVEERLKAEGNPELMKTWTNTKMGEVYEDRSGEMADWAKVYARIETYLPLTVPPQVVMITCSADTQDKYLSAHVYGWGMGEECWLLYATDIHGDANGDQVWKELDDLIATRFKHPNGKYIFISKTTVDSGGHASQSVYNYARTRKARGVVAVHGATTPGRMVVSKPSDVEFNFRGVKIKKGARTWNVGSDTAKHVLYSRLNMTSGPILHFYKGLEVEYFKQLCSEKWTLTFKDGVKKWKWKKTRVRNEACDNWVYGYAAAIMAGLQKPKIMSDLQKKYRMGKVTPKDGISDVTVKPAIEPVEPPEADEPEEKAVVERGEMQDLPPEFEPAPVPKKPNPSYVKRRIVRRPAKNWVTGYAR